MTAAAIFENRKITISQQWFDRSSRNLARWRILAGWLISSLLAVENPAWCTGDIWTIDVGKGLTDRDNLTATQPRLTRSAVQWQQWYPIAWFTLTRIIKDNLIMFRHTFRYGLFLRFVFSTPTTTAVSCLRCCTTPYGVMAALCNRADHYIFALWFLSSIFFFFSSPNLSGRRLDVYHTSIHGVASANLECRRKKRHFGTIAQFCRANLRNLGMYRQSEKKHVKQQYLVHMFW